MKKMGLKDHGPMSVSAGTEQHDTAPLSLTESAVSSSS